MREALSAFDLEAVAYPCPRGGTRFRPKVEERGGRAMFPYLVDPNTSRSMYESADIVRYLGDTYGASGATWLGPLSVASGEMGREAFVARSGKMMVPYLVDPNTGRAMFESAHIVRYLDATYAIAG